MSCMESGKDIHLERTTGCQFSVPRLDTTNGELLVQLGLPHRISPRATCPHASAGLCNTLFTNTLIYWKGTVFRVTVIRCNLVLPSVWMTHFEDLVFLDGTPIDSINDNSFKF